MRLEDFLGLLENPYTKYLVVTFFAALVSMILKASSRPDSKMASQEDWMLGFDFAQLAMFALVTDGVTPGFAWLLNKLPARLPCCFCAFS
jgi:hypothetical protein